MSGRSSNILFLAIALLGGLLVARPLWADGTWDEKKREQAKEEAQKAVDMWNTFQPFKFKITHDVYARTNPPKHSPFYVFYPEHYGRRNVLQMHPYDLELENGIEAQVKIPPTAKTLRFVVAAHDEPRADVIWLVKINGAQFFSQTLKTEGTWKIVRVPVSEYAGQEVSLRIDVKANGWAWEFLFLETVGFAGHRFCADNGPIRLSFEQFDSALVRIDMGRQQIGCAEALLAQFEKKGIGYKKTGIGWAETNSVKAIKVIESKLDRCVVEATAERTTSEETKRTFEATFRFTIYAGQNWFESQLVSIRNTDKVPYELMGYGHGLRPADANAAPVSFPNCGGLIGAADFFGAFGHAPDDFCFAMRRGDAASYGDITRKLSAKVEPGSVWNAPSEPALVIFCGKGSTGEVVFKAAERLRPLSACPSTIGEIKYHEEKGTAQE